MVEIEVESEAHSMRRSCSETSLEIGQEDIFMSWSILTLLGILVFSPKSLLYRTLMKDDKSDPYAQSIVFFGLGGTLAFLFSLFQS